MEFWKNHFGRRLKAARQKKGLSQAKLGEALGDDLKVEPSSVSRWETGHDSPDERRLSKLFEILEVNENYFLELKDLDPASSLTFAASFLSNFANRPPTLQKLVLALVFLDKGHLTGASDELHQSFQSLSKLR